MHIFFSVQVLYFIGFSLLVFSRGWSLLCRQHCQFTAISTLPQQVNVNAVRGFHCNSKNMLLILKQHETWNPFCV